MKLAVILVLFAHNVVGKKRASHRIDTVVGPIDLVAELGEGSFGAVFLGKWVSNNNQPVAVKIEKDNVQASNEDCLVEDSPEGLFTLSHEYKMLTLMQGTVGFPKVFGFEDTYYVMELLEQGLFRSKHASRIRPIAIQMVDRLHALHEKGFLMNDVHPGNFMISRGIVYVIDLAWAAPINGKPAIDDECRHIAFGTSGDTGYPKDDLVRLMYTLVYLSGAELPWAGKRYLFMADRLKRTLPAHKVCKGSAAWLLPACSYILALEPRDPVDYASLKLLLDQRHNRWSRKPTPKFLRRL